MEFNVEICLKQFKFYCLRHVIVELATERWKLNAIPPRSAVI